MRLRIEDIVLFEGNEEAFDRILAITSNVERTMLFVHGPAGSGKSAVMRARAFERDLLSKRKVLFTHAAEIITAIHLNENEHLLERVGSEDILLIDSLDDFIAKDTGAQILQLLVNERNAQGLSTVIAARSSLSSYDSNVIGATFQQFDEVQVNPLDASGRISYARNLQRRIAWDAKCAPRLTDEALGYVANDFSKDISDIEFVMTYLLTDAGFEPDAEVDLAMARAALTSVD